MPNDFYRKGDFVANINFYPKVDNDDSEALLANINAAEQIVHSSRWSANFGPNILPTIWIFCLLSWADFDEIIEMYYFPFFKILWASSNVRQYHFFLTFSFSFSCRNKFRAVSLVAVYLNGRGSLNPTAENQSCKKFWKHKIQLLLFFPWGRCVANILIKPFLKILIARTVLKILVFQSILIRPFLKYRYQYRWEQSWRYGYGNFAKYLVRRLMQQEKQIQD